MKSLCKIPSVFLFLAVVFLMGCGEFGQTAPRASSSSAKVDIVLPDGVSFKSDGGITGASALSAATVTGISLTVSASDMDTLVEEIPIDTLEVFLDVRSGDARTFIVTVTTDTGETFSGSETVDLFAGDSIELFISVTVSSQNSSLAIGTWEYTDSNGTQTFVMDSTTLTHIDPDGCTVSGTYTISNNTITATITSESSQCSGTNGYTLNVPFDMTINVTETTLYLNGGPANGETYTRVTTPSAPTGVSATAGNGQVTVSWDAVSDAKSYNIYWSTSSGVTVGSPSAINTTSTSYTHTGLTNGTTYYYVVTAENSAGESSVSSEVNATPATSAATTPSAPTGVSATAGNGQVTVSWNSVSNADYYNLYYEYFSGVTKSNGSKITPINGTSHVHVGPLTSGVTIYYVVTAENSTGESAESAEVSATP